MDTDYLIIGNSAGGIAAAESIRQADKKGGILMVSDEPYPAYSRPLIAKILTGERTLEEILFRPEGFYKENRTTLLEGKKVIELDMEKHIANLESGEVINWKKLLLATGGKPIVPPIKGIDKKGVFNFITMDDAKAINKHLPEVEQVVVIGDNRKFVSALIVPSFEALEGYARSNQIPFKTRADLIINPKIIDFFQKRIDERTKNLPGFEKIRRFKLLDDEFSIDRDEITPTMKIKRKQVGEKYSRIIEGMYGEVQN